MRNRYIFLSLQPGLQLLPGEDRYFSYYIYIYSFLNSLAYGNGEKIYYQWVSSSMPLTCCSLVRNKKSLCEEVIIWNVTFEKHRIILFNMKPLTSLYIQLGYPCWWVYCSLLRIHLTNESVNKNRSSMSRFSITQSHTFGCLGIAWSFSNLSSMQRQNLFFSFYSLLHPHLFLPFFRSFFSLSFPLSLSLSFYSLLYHCLSSPSFFLSSLLSLVRFCWLANTSVSMCSSSWETIVYEFIFTSLTVTGMSCSSYFYGLWAAVL